MERADQNADAEAEHAVSAAIGRRLRWAREGRDMTRAELAGCAGTDLSAIRKLENGDRAPSVFLAMSLCHILEISPQYLLWGILEGVESRLAARLSREHPELQLSHQVQHKKMPSPGKTRKSVGSSARASAAR